MEHLLLSFLYLLFRLLFELLHILLLIYLALLFLLYLKILFLQVFFYLFLHLLVLSLFQILLLFFYNILLRFLLNFFAISSAFIYFTCFILQIILDTVLFPAPEIPVIPIIKLKSLLELYT